MNIRPVSDLRNKFPEVEKEVVESGHPVFLTKNGYGTMVLMSIDQYELMTQDIESKLDEADHLAASTDIRYGLDEVIERVKERINHHA
ncbi:MULTISPECIES: type II toxin-antitoxin system Phd/YefM family antitoxin [Aerococcus]|uniref:Antitoxin n=1 Tax=Aerococcus tenax TaxID=3078812 RepID=A0A5N1BR01_9LACT|nr:type II toxin-antitoxin system Phd/YefM family antitoxin [Aerococcus urinae]KAA9241021.1 type II toxin-antitoxin system Phd/YefM family antitoxin [Aerococcus urinae]MDK6370474.1 type II toxin-antitoxin system Phd/YefM family antitoxin [Aerococcus urinae]MDK6596854.1 type II toxin-antitoxin system Phd/YefM family antitoxin [Aerococcus urinae]MDK7302317.1 type II toxin-antitoxin system Phd/YefM family antitoxin [Aerococcus urinae]MDK7800730.1 type II toxin-antitoxin system Phd/YefM family ant